MDELLQEFETLLVIGVWWSECPLNFNIVTSAYDGDGKRAVASCLAATLDLSICQNQGPLTPSLM